MVVNFISHQDTFNVSCITVDNIALCNTEGLQIVKIYYIICNRLKAFINSAALPY